MKNIRRISKKYYLRQIVACFLTAYMLFGFPMQMAQASPQNGQWQVGGGTIIDGIPNSSVAVNQAESVIKWDGFNTASGESVTFTQGLMSNSAVLNKIMLGGRTNFNGALSASDMRIFIVNPSGVIFGPTSSVNANQLVASSMNMSNAAFHDAVNGGDMVFTNPSSYSGARVVANYGTINAVDSVYLVGKNVLNAGTIITNPGGLVAMVAGDEMVLAQPGSPTIVKTLKVNNIEHHTVDNGGIGGENSNMWTEFGYKNTSGQTGTVSAVGGEAVVGELVLAAGDVWSNAIDNVQDLTATARGDIHFEEAIDITGDLKAQAGLPTQYDDYWTDWWDGWTHYKEEQPLEVKQGGDVHAKDTINAVGDMTVLANGITLEGDADVGGDLSLTGRWGEDPVDGFHNIETAALTAGGNIDISVTGVTDQKIWEQGDWDWSWDHWAWLRPGEWVGNPTPTYEPGTITLNGDVTAIAGNLTLYNDTDVTLPATLQAGTDLVLLNSPDPYENATTLDGTTSLTLIAGDEIQAGNTTISVTGSKLTMHQGLSLDTADYLFANQGNTHLTLISDTGSVTSDSGDNAANKWASIGAHAQTDIELGKDGGSSLEENTIFLGDAGIDGEDISLLAETGSIDIYGDAGNTGDDAYTVKNHDDYSDWAIEAGQNIDIQAIHEITLGGDATAHSGYMNLQADIDKRYGSHVWAKGALSSGTTMDIEGMNVFLDEGATAGGDMTIVAHGLYGIAYEPDEYLQYSGDVRAGGKLESETGKIDITAVRATGHSGETLTGYNNLDTSEEPYLNMNIVDYENTYTGSILVQDVEAETYIAMTAGYDIETDTVDAGTTLDIRAGRDITLNNATDSYTQSGSHMMLKADLSDTAVGAVADEDGDVLVKGTVTALDDGGSGISMWMQAEDITLEKAAKAYNGDMILMADFIPGSLDGQFRSDSTLTTYGGGSIEIMASDNTISLGGDVTASVANNGDILLHNNTVADDGITLKAGQDVIVGNGSGDGTMLMGEGALTVEADRNITLGGDVKAAKNVTGDLKLLADNDENWDGDVHAYGEVKTINSNPGLGNIEIEGRNVTLEDTVRSARDLTITARGPGGDSGSDVQVLNSSPLKSNGYMTVHADDNILLTGTGWHPDSAKSNYDMELWANYDGGTVGNMTAYHDLRSLYGDIDIYSADETTFLYGDYVDAGGSVYLHNNTEAAGDIIAYQDVTIDGTLTLIGDDSGCWGHSDQYITATNGQLYANDWVHKLSPSLGTGNLEMFGGFNGPLYPDMDYSVWTQDVTVDGGELAILGNACVRLDGSIYSTGDMTLAANYDGIASTPSSPGPPSPSIPYDYLVHYNGTIESLNGDVDLSAQNSFIALDGGNASEYVTAGDDILIRDYTWVQYSRKLDAGDDVVLAAGKRLQGNQNLTIEAGDNIVLGGDVVVKGSLVAKAGLDNPSSWCPPSSSEGFIEAAGDITAADMLLTAGWGWPGYEVSTPTQTYVHVAGMLTSTAGDITVGAQHDIVLGGKDVDGTWTSVDAAGNLTLDGDWHSPYYGDGYKGGDVVVDGAINAGGSADMFANNITLGGDVVAGGDIILTSGTSSDFADPSPEGDVTAHGNLTSTGGSVEIYSDGDTTYLGGDVTAFADVLLNNNTRFMGFDDQHVTAQNGMITANGWLEKLFTSLYLHADGDISLADYVTAGCCLDGDFFNGFEASAFEILRPQMSCGGVSIISDAGKIFTPGYGDTLNVAITGSSSYLLGTGVDLPYGDGKAAIVIISKEDLKLGSGAELTACGVYDTTGTVDDRAAINFLDYDGSFPAGAPRDQGDPFDLAIYVASTEGNVDVSAPVSIMSSEWIVSEIRDIDGGKGAMVIDAYDTVTFGSAFEDSLAGNGVTSDVGNRLEVVSRRSEWLEDAVGRLPYVIGGGPFVSGYNYVLRGSGADNSAIGDGAPAWVLIARSPTPELSSEGGQIAEEQEFGEGGCPALMQWLAGEIGLPADEIQIYFSEAYAYSTDIQPCETCSRLRDASLILQDPEGNRIAALAQVVNEYITAPTPPSDEQMAMIASTFAEHTGDATYYADAGAWIDALAQYVGIMNSELGFTTTESMAFVGKYITPVTGTGNASLISYVEGRLSVLGG